MCRSLVCVSAGGREYLQESQRCSAKGVQISNTLFHPLNEYNERFKDNYLLSTSSPQALGSGVQCQLWKAIPVAAEPSLASAPRAGGS